MQVVLLHIYKMVPDQKLHRLHVVLVFVTAFNQTPANMKPETLNLTDSWKMLQQLSGWCRISTLYKNCSNIDAPGDLLVAPLRAIGTSILQGFKHQQVALPVAKQQVGIGATRSIQKTFDSLEDGMSVKT